MKDQYLTLGTLRKIDEKANRLKKELEKIPVEVQKLHASLKTKQDIFNVVKTATEAYEKKLRTREQDLREKEDFLKKAESKMMEVKTNDEYKAAMKENEGHLSEKKKIEEEILVLMSGLDAERNKLKTAEAEFKEFESVVKKEKDELEAERVKLVKFYEEQTDKRKQCAEKLTPEFAAAYIKATKRGTGAAIEIVDNCMCLGCNIKIRAQLYNEVLGMKTIHLCPSCKKILVSQQVDADSSIS